MAFTCVVFSDPDPETAEKPFQFAHNSCVYWDARGDFTWSINLPSPRCHGRGSHIRCAMNSPVAEAANTSMKDLFNSGIASKADRLEY